MLMSKRIQRPRTSRSRRWIAIPGFVVVAALIGVLLSAVPGHARTALVLTLDGPIGPVTAMMVENAVEQAEDLEAAVLIIELDTPGGLMTTTKDITQSILNATVPVVVYVAPSGASATSAGVFILMSAHFAVMAPGTNVGAAHPVLLQGEMDSTMFHKAENDAAANMRALANRRGRNADWAERAVRASESITAEVAVDSNVVDFIAANIADLLDSLNGRDVELPMVTVTMHTADLEVERIEPSWREKILTVLTNPNIAYILMSIGWLGIMMELYNPGAIFPGVVGAICLILGFYSLQTLPINYAGLALIVVAIIMFILEVKIVSHGMLTVGGAIAMLIGSLMLIDSPHPAARLSLSVILSVVGATAAFFIFAMWMALKARLRQPTTGVEGLIGQVGKAKSAFEGEGMVFVAGEYWRARSSVPIAADVKVRVVRKEGMVLIVEPVA